MKNKCLIIFILILSSVLFLISCDTDGGSGTINFTVETQARTTFSQKLLDTIGTEPNIVYNDPSLNDYIAAVTPTKFKVPLIFITLASSESGTQSILNYASSTEKAYADFANGTVLECSNVNPGTFDILFFTMFDHPCEVTTVETLNLSLEFEVDLPVEYDGVPLQQIIDYDGTESEGTDVYATQTGTTIQTNTLAMATTNIYDDLSTPYLYIFGLTDTSSVFNSEHNDVTYQVGNATLGTGNAPAIRAPFETITIPYEYELINISFSYNIENIIHIYQGVDGVSYTEDDIIILAPNYWERMSLSSTVTE